MVARNWVHRLDRVCNWILGFGKSTSSVEGKLNGSRSILDIMNYDSRKNKQIGIFEIQQFMNSNLSPAREVWGVVVYDTTF